MSATWLLSRVMSASVEKGRRHWLQPFSEFFTSDRALEKIKALPMFYLTTRLLKWHLFLG
jgi:hypothetical protein